MGLGRSNRVVVLSVYPHTRGLLVLVEVALEGEGLSAAPADEGLGRRVCLNVGPEIGLVGESLGALGTLEWLLARVGSDVSLQEPGSREALAAEGALAALAVGAHVHRKGRHGDVHLGAVRALPGLLVRHATVGLPVPGQVAGGAVTLAALGTRVVRFAVGQRRAQLRWRVLLQGADLLKDCCENADRGGRLLRNIVDR